MKTIVIEENNLLEVQKSNNIEISQRRIMPIPDCRHAMSDKTSWYQDCSCGDHLSYRYSHEKQGFFFDKINFKMLLNLMLNI